MPAGGAQVPQLSGLRALREQPALVDDAAVAHLLGPDVLPADDARWARAWLVCSQAALMGNPRHGLEPTSGLTFDPRAVSAPKGIGTTSRRDEVLGVLLSVGVLRSALPPHEEGVVRLRVQPTGSAASRQGVELPEQVAWSDTICKQHPAAVALDWLGLTSACGREPAALLVVRTLAEFLLPLDTWAMVPRRDLVDRTGYQQKQVRMALRRLVGVGLLEAEGESGRVARYRFTPIALGQRWQREAPSDSPPTVPPASSGAGSPGTLEASPSPRSWPVGASRGVDSGQGRAPATPSSGLELIVGGVTVRVASGATLDVDAGAQARVEVAADGRVRLTIA